MPSNLPSAEQCKRGRFAHSRGSTVSIHRETKQQVPRAFIQPFSCVPVARHTEASCRESWRSFSKFTFDEETSKLSYYVLRTECLGGAFSWEYDEEAIRTNRDYEKTLHWIDCDGQIAVEKVPDKARWYTLWTRSEAPLASFPFRAKNLGPEAWQEFRTTTDGKWFSQDRT